MAGSAGSLVVSLGLDAADYVSGLNKAQYQAAQATRQIAQNFESLASGAKEAAAAIGVAFGVHEVLAWGEAILSNAEAIHQLSQETGSAVEDISKLENAGILAGKSFDDVRSIVEKFTATLGGTGEKSEQLQALLKQLKVTATDPVQAVFQLATALNKFSDGAIKAADARLAFGRGGVTFISTLASIAENQDIVGTKTAEQIKNAEELEKSYRTLAIQSHALRDAFLEDIVPALSTMIENFLEARKASDDLFNAFKVWTQLSLFGKAEDDVARLEGELAKLQKTVAEGGKVIFGIKFGFDEKNYKENIDNIQKALDIAYARQLRERGGAPTNAQMVKPPPPKPPNLGEQDQVARKLLEQQLHAQEAAVKQEQSILQARETFLQAYYQDDLISINAYFTARTDALGEATDKEIAAYQKEIAAVEEFKRKARKPQDVTEADTKIADITEKITKLQEDRAAKTILLSLDQDRAAQKYQDTLKGIDAQVLLLTGHQAEAAAIQFNLQNAELERRLLAEGNVEAQKKIAFLREQAVAQAALNKAASDYSNIQQALGIEQGYVQLLQQTGALTELDAINKRSDLAQKYIPILRQQLELQQEIADTLSGGERTKALLQIEQLKLGIAQLSAESEVLQSKFRDIFSGATADFISSLVDGTKSLKDAFKDLEKQIVSSITKIASQNISESLFGKGGALGAIPKFFSDTFSGKGADALSSLTGGGKDAATTALATASTAATASLDALTASTSAGSASEIAASAAMDVLAASAASAAAALASVAASSAAGDVAKAASSIDFSEFADIIGTGAPGLAAGGFPSVGRVSVVGENGPELFVPRVQGAILTKHQLSALGRGGKSLGITVNVLPGASKASADQAAASMALELRRASARNL